MIYSAYKFRPVLGLCGSGKSDFMEGLCREDAQVLDFEKLLGIEGACLAPVTLDKQVAELKEQIDQHLRGLDPQMIIYVEWKSPMVLGHPLPIDLVSAVRAAQPIVLTQPFEVRIRNLILKYQIWADHLDLVVKKIEARGAPPELIQDLSCQKEPDHFVATLLPWLDQEYRSEMTLFTAKVSIDDMNRAIAARGASSGKTF